MSLGYAPYVPHDYTQDYFTMVVTTSGNITWKYGGNSSNALSYSTDGGTTWSTASNNISLQVNDGDKVLWKGTASPRSGAVHPGIGTFSGDNNVRYSVEGNIMSLVGGDNFKNWFSVNNYVFHKLFYNNKNITNAENLLLPATTLADYCYTGMFRNCANLTTAPELPATTLANNCYSNMFAGCTSLTTAPKLPATQVLYYSCYYGMFNGCTNLNSIKCLASSMTTGATNDWVNGVAASGTFTKAANMTRWTEGVNGIPSGWTVENA